MTTMASAMVFGEFVKSSLQREGYGMAMRLGDLLEKLWGIGLISGLSDGRRVETCQIHLTATSGVIWALHRFRWLIPLERLGAGRSDSGAVGRVFWRVLAFSRQLNARKMSWISRARVGQ
jgi:hypothetical protein